MGGWGEPRGTGTTSEVDAAHKLLDGAGIPTGVLASRIEEALLANRTVDGRRLTWRELYELEHEQRVRADRWATLVSDLDRCEHGRHDDDACSGCNGISFGNPLRLPRLLDDGVSGLDRIAARFGGWDHVPSKLVGFGLSGVLRDVVGPDGRRPSPPPVDPRPAGRVVISGKSLYKRTVFVPDPLGEFEWWLPTLLVDVYRPERSAWTFGLNVEYEGHPSEA